MTPRSLQPLLQISSKTVRKTPPTNPTTPTHEGKKESGMKSFRSLFCYFFSVKMGVEMRPSSRRRYS